MLTRTIFLVGIIALTAQTQSPWFGTWTLNFSGDARYKRVVLKISPWQNGLKVTYDYVGIRGGVSHMEWTGKFDGKDYPVQGSDYVLTNAYSLVDDHNYRIVVKAEGTMVATASVSISADGKKLSSVTSGQDGRTTEAVYERR